MSATWLGTHTYTFPRTVAPSTYPWPWSSWWHTDETGLHLWVQAWLHTDYDGLNLLTNKMVISWRPGWKERDSMWQGLFRDGSQVTGTNSAAHSLAQLCLVLWHHRSVFDFKAEQDTGMFVDIGTACGPQKEDIAAPSSKDSPLWEGLVKTLAMHEIRKI